MDEHRPPFEGTKIRLRAWEPEDLPALVTIFNEPSVQEGFAAERPVTVEEQQVWYEEAAGRGDLSLVIERRADGALVGGCALSEITPANRTAAVEIFVGAAYQGDGIGTDALRTLCRYAFEHVNLQRIQLDVLVTNERAIAAYEKVGFVVEGRLRRSEFVGGRYVDELVMGLLAEELTEP